MQKPNRFSQLYFIENKNSLDSYIRSRNRLEALLLYYYIKLFFIRIVDTSTTTQFESHCSWKISIKITFYFILNSIKTFFSFLV